MRGHNNPPRMAFSSNLLHLLVSPRGKDAGGLTPAPVNDYRAFPETADDLGRAPLQIGDGCMGVEMIKLLRASRGSVAMVVAIIEERKKRFSFGSVPRNWWLILGITVKRGDGPSEGPSPRSRKSLQLKGKFGSGGET